MTVRNRLVALTMIHTYTPARAGMGRIGALACPSESRVAGPSSPSNVSSRYNSKSAMRVRTTACESCSAAGKRLPLSSSEDVPGPRLAYEAVRLTLSRKAGDSVNHPAIQEAGMR
jgi:hypothetical protein